MEPIPFVPGETIMGYIAQFFYNLFVVLLMAIGSLG
jgi:hypothetical protein